MTWFFLVFIILLVVYVSFGWVTYKRSLTRVGKFSGIDKYLDRELVLFCQKSVGCCCEERLIKKNDNNVNYHEPKGIVASKA